MLNFAGNSLWEDLKGKPVQFTGSGHIAKGVPSPDIAVGFSGSRQSSKRVIGYLIKGDTHLGAIAPGIPKQTGYDALIAKNRDRFWD